MSINIGNSIKFFDAIVTVVSCPLSVAASDLKSDNLQYNMMRQWDDSMNAPTESATHCLTELFLIYQNKHWTIIPLYYIEDCRIYCRFIKEPPCKENKTASR